MISSIYKERRLLTIKTILDELNPEQRNATTSNSKYLQIMAGPGTGKTTTLAARILHFQTNLDYNSDSLMAISFSRSAKQQLINKMTFFTERIGYGSMVNVLTFHSLAHKIIRYGIHFGESKLRNGFETISTENYIRKNPSITRNLCIEYKDRESVSLALAKGLNLLRQGSQLRNDICRNWLDINANDEFKINMEDGQRIIIPGKDMIEYWKRADKINKILNCTDFQGLIIEAERLLRKRKNTFEAITKDLRHILVDEYQDTSLSQESFLYSLADIDKNITVVGDKNQAIYTFNGSNPNNMERFYTKFSTCAPEDTEKIYLSRNYRSNNNIINLSNHLIGENVIQPGIDRSESINPVIVNTHSIDLAATFIAGEIENLKFNNNISLSDIHILYRKNSEFSPQADKVIEEMQKYGIPFHMSSVFSKEQNESLEDLKKVCDEYPGLELLDIMEELKNRKSGSEYSINLIQEAINQGAVDTDDLLDFIIDIEIDRLKESSEESTVSLSTVHSAKGQEYPIVFILYLGDTTFPHGSHPDIGEEKRLLYVGITRAMKRLYIIGQHGIRFEDFLGICMDNSNVVIKEFHSRYEENKGKGFSESEVNQIQETTKDLERQEQEKMKQLVDMMDEW